MQDDQLSQLTAQLAEAKEQIGALEMSAELPLDMISTLRAALGEKDAAIQRLQGQASKAHTAVSSVSNAEVKRVSSPPSLLASSHAYPPHPPARSLGESTGHEFCVLFGHRNVTLVMDSVVSFFQLRDGVLPFLLFFRCGREARVRKFGSD